MNRLNEQAKLIGGREPFSTPSWSLKTNLLLGHSAAEQVRKFLSASLLTSLTRRISVKRLDMWTKLAEVATEVADEAGKKKVCEEAK